MAFQDAAVAAQGQTRTILQVLRTRRDQHGEVAIDRDRARTMETTICCVLRSKNSEFLEAQRIESMPKVGNWWLGTRRLLTSGDDPTGELSAASDQFPDEYTPTVFMTGDGHGSPPFQWLDKGVWPDFFRDLIADDKICCHVEKYSDAPTRDSVPISLRPVFDNGKVFGWEPEFYKIIQKIMELYIDTAPKAWGEIPRQDAAEFIGWVMGVPKEIRFLADIRQDVEVFAEILARETSDKNKFLPNHMGASFQGIVKKYRDTAYLLRTEIHDIVGATIQRNINKYSDHIHLITCGDAHITENPLYRYIDPPIGCFGVADASKM